MQGYVLRVGESFVTSIWHIDSMAINMSQIAIGKSKFIDFLNTTSNGDGGEAATRESSTFYACNTLPLNSSFVT